MIRTLVRGLGTLGALWTLAVLSGPTVLHPCEAHGARGAVPDAHAMHHAAAGAAGVDDAAPPAPLHCTCIECCCATSPVAFAIRATMRVREVLQPGHVGWWATPASAPPRALAHRLPFANGPPARLA
jgi:hypothetical protein